MSQTPSLLSAVYQPKPAAGPRPFASVLRRDEAIGAVGNAGRVGQQIANGDLTAGGHGGRLAVLAGDGDRGLGVRGDEAADRIVDTDLAFLDEREDADARDRLGLRGNPEDRVGRHPAIGFLVGPADCLLVNRFAVAQHQRRRAADPVFIDVLLEQRVDPLETLDRKPAADGVARRRRSGRARRLCRPRGGLRLRHQGRPRQRDRRQDEQSVTHEAS